MHRIRLETMYNCTHRWRHTAASAYCMRVYDMVSNGGVLGTWHSADRSSNLLSLEPTAGATTHAAWLRCRCYCADEHSRLHPLELAARWRSPTTEHRCVTARTLHPHVDHAPS